LLLAMKRSSRRSGAGALALHASEGLLAALPPPPPQRSEEWSSSASPDGLCFAFGWNGNGQLGLGDSVERAAPRPLRSMFTSGIRVRLIAAGSSHSVAIDEEGVAHAWGNNAHGQLGMGDKIVRMTPEAIGCDGQRLAGVACGAKHTVFCTSRGRVLACGSNSNGQLGLGTPADDDLVLRPEMLSALSGTRVVAVACGFAHTLFLSRPGAVLACGAGELGQLGLGSVPERCAGHHERPTSAVLGTKQEQPRVAAPNGHDVFTLTSVRAPHDVFTPSSVAELASVACSAIACGNYHSCALSRDEGVVYTWGEGRYE